MIVVDASAIVDVLTIGSSAAAEERMADEALHGPDHLGLEVLQALRRLLRTGAVSAELAAGAVESLAALRVRRHPLAAIEARVWALRDRLSTYDAAYVALAEHLGAPLFTSDRRLERGAAGLVEVIAV